MEKNQKSNIKTQNQNRSKQQRTATKMNDEPKENDTN